MKMTFDEEIMRIAIGEAELAFAQGEIPVGAVIVKDGKILSKAHNLCQNETDATAHAELLAISQACRAVGSWRLCGCTLYVTMEPCPMCMGAIINSRIDRVVYGVKDARAGACHSLLSLQNYPLESSPECVGGVLERECVSLLQSFFAKKRRN